MNSIIQSVKDRFAQSLLMKSFLITTVGSGLSKVILIASTFYCTHMLSEAEFGEYSFVRTTLDMILTICACNFSSLCTKFATEAKYRIEALQKLFLLFLFSLFLCTLAGVLLVLLPDNTLTKILGSSNMMYYIKVASILLPVFMLQPLIEGVLRGLMKFKLISWAQILSSVFFLATLAVGIQLAGAKGAVLGLYAYYGIYSIAVFCCFLRIGNIRSNLPKVKGFWNQKDSLVKMILPVFLMSFIDAPVAWLITLMLSKYASIEAVGGLSILVQLRNIAFLIPTYFFNTFIAFAGTLNAQKKYNEYFMKFDKLVIYALLGGFIFYLIFTAGGKGLLWLYGAGYTKYWKYMILSNLLIPIKLLTMTYRTELILQEHQQSLFIIAIVWNLVWIGLFALLVNLGIDALWADLIAGTIGVISNLLPCLYIYNKDKKRLCANLCE